MFTPTYTRDQEMAKLNKKARFAPQSHVDTEKFKAMQAKFISKMNGAESEVSEDIVNAKLKKLKLGGF